jgi:hypothetical protein
MLDSPLPDTVMLDFTLPDTVMLVFPLPDTVMLDFPLPDTVMPDSPLPPQLPLLPLLPLLPSPLKPSSTPSNWTLDMLLPTEFTKFILWNHLDLSKPKHAIYPAKLPTHPPIQF